MTQLIGTPSSAIESEIGKHSVEWLIVGAIIILDIAHRNARSMPRI